jgi:hypothetical protein
MQTMPVCRGYQCTSTDLIKAHIIPACFAREIRGSHQHNLKISLDKVHPTQHGVFDPNILCGNCDGILGKLDDYALEVCRRFPREHLKTEDGGFEMRNVDGDRFAAFVLAVLWRASITSRVEFRKVLLGPYEDEAREVIFGAKPLHKMAAYQLLLARYTPPSGNFNPAGNYTSPARLKLGGANAWAFALHGFRIIAKIDRRPLPAGFHLIVANGRTTLNGPFVPYHATAEGRAMAEMKKADLARLARRSIER